ncbi:MAG: TolC family protein [Bacteroidales bacterium]|jgi:outer membrane protein
MKKAIKIFYVLILGLASLPLHSQTDSVWTLTKCIEYAFNRNITVRKSELSNQILGLDAEQAKAQRLPLANAAISQNFNWSRSTDTGENGFTASNGSNYSINSGITIYSGSRINNIIKQAVLSISGGVYSLETTKETISLNILNAYLQVLYAEEQVKNSRKQIESTAEQLRLASERLTLRAISESDYAQVKSQLATEKLNLANAEGQLAIDKVILMQLMELPVTTGFNIQHPDLGESLNENRIPDVKAVFEAALAIKPQIKNAAVNKDIAALNEKIAKAGYIPTLSASAALTTGYSTSAADIYFNQLNNTIRPSLGFSLSIPIYQQKQVKTNVAVARIGYQDAELSEKDTKNQLRKSIEQTCQDVISSQIEYEANLENFSATKESSDLSGEKFRQGIINSVDYLVSKTNLIVAESQLLQSKYKLIFNYKILDFYKGIPLSL